MIRALGLACLFALGVWSQACAQSLTSAIRDAAGPLPGAFILVLSPDGARAIAQGITDADGRSAIVLPEGTTAALVSVEMLGYEPQRHAVTFSDNGEPTMLSVTLIERTFDLQEVQVQGKRRATTVGNNDTSALDLTTFRDSSEQSIAQLLARSPDVELQSNGLLKYRGQAVNRVLVDGKDIFGAGQYAQPLARLSPDIVKGANAVERFHEDAVLARLEPSNETVIDITTKEEARGTVDGQARLAEGSTPQGAWRYRHEAGAILLDGPAAYYADATASRLATTTAGFSSRSDAFSLDGKSPEPVGESYDELPSQTSAWNGNLAQAPAEIVGDALVADLGVRALLNGRGAARTRFEVKAQHGADEIENVSSLGATGTDVDYRLDTRRASSVAGQGYLLSLDHYNAAPSGKTSWRVHARAEPWRERSEARVTLLQPGAPDQDFRQNNRATNLPLYLGARANQALGATTALQVFAQADRGTLADDLRVDVDTTLLDAVGFAERRTNAVDQTRALEYRVLRAGAKVFWRQPWATLQFYAVATDQLSTPKIDLAQRGETLPTQALAQSYGTQRLGGSLVAPLSRMWRADASVEQIGVQDQRLSRSATATGYRVRAEYVDNGRPVYSLYNQRRVRLPFLPYESGLRYLSDPFSLEVPLAVVTPTFSDQVGATASRRLRALDIDYRASLRYTYRESEILNTYDLTQRSQVVNRAGQRRVDALDGALRLTHVSLELRLVSNLTLTGYRRSAESNVVDAAGQVRTTGMGLEYKLSWPGYLGIAPTLIVNHQHQDVRGAIDTRSRNTTASLLIAYFADRWRWNVRGSLGQANANGFTARTYGYLEAGGSYELRADRSGVTLGVRGYNLAGERRARNVSFGQPFLSDVRTEAAPAAVVVEAWVPIRGRKK